MRCRFSSPGYGRSGRQRNKHSDDRRSKCAKELDKLCRGHHGNERASIMRSQCDEEFDRTCRGHHGDEHGSIMPSKRIKKFDRTCRGHHGDEHGNAVVEFLIVPLVLLPLLLVLTRAAGIEHAQMQLTSASRDLQRAVDLTDGVTAHQLRALALVMLSDNAPIADPAVAVAATATGWRVTLAARTAGLLPGTSVPLRETVVVQP